MVGSFEGDGSPYINLTDGLVYNGSAFVGSVQRPRNQFNAALNYFATLGGRSHNFKAGVDYQDIESTNAFTFPNNELFVVSDFDPSRTCRSSSREISGSSTRPSSRRSRPARSTGSTPSTGST